LAEVKSAEQLREDYCRVLGPELGDLFYALWNEMTWLEVKWQQYCQLYAASAKRIELLNGSAPFFFRVVQDVLWEDVILSIARLTGPPRSMGKDNLTLLRLPALVEDAALGAELETALEETVAAAAFAKDWRNRRLAHRDLALAIGERVEPLTPASRTAVREALSNMHRVFDLLQARYFGSPIAWDLLSTPPGAEALLYRLAAAQLAEEKRFKRLREGKALPDDLEEPDEI
jgi:AbiU2